jgi:hypothetical protein
MSARDDFAVVPANLPPTALSALLELAHFARQQAAEERAQSALTQAAAAKWDELAIKVEQAAALFSHENSG